MDILSGVSAMHGAEYGLARLGFNLVGFATDMATSAKSEQGLAYSNTMFLHLNRTVNLANAHALREAIGRLMCVWSRLV